MNMLRNIQIDSEIHKVIKIHCAMNGSSIKDMVEEACLKLINEKGGNNEKGLH
jgi:hypothetical protein